MSTKFNPEKHHRRSIRVPGYDYTHPGAYFVTLVAWQRQCLFGDVHSGAVSLNKAGEIIQQIWAALPGYFPFISLDAAVVMPNHFHAILVLTGDGKGEASANELLTFSHVPQADASPLQPIGTVPGSLGAIVQNFKSVSTRKINQASGERGVHVWQRNYFERIIRNDAELARIREYILQNPAHWDEDAEKL